MTIPISLTVMSVTTVAAPIRHQKNALPIPNRRGPITALLDLRQHSILNTTNKYDDISLTVMTVTAVAAPIRHQRNALPIPNRSGPITALKDPAAGRRGNGNLNLKFRYQFSLRCRRQIPKRSGKGVIQLVWMG